MKIGVILYAFMLVEPLARVIQHMLDAGADVYLFQHSNKPEVANICAGYLWNHHVHVAAFGFNRGLAKSFNDGLVQGFHRDGMDVMFTCNDDLMPGPGDIQRLAAAAMANRDKYFVNGRCITGGRDEDSDLSLAAINPIALETIGYSDENFFPAYFEDVDWQRRGRLAGLQALTIPDTTIVHQGSASLPHVDKHQHDKQFLANQAYYVKKWGGAPGQEAFTRPFERFGLKIEQDERHHPYGEYDREELVTA